MLGAEDESPLGSEKVAGAEASHGKQISTNNSFDVDEAGVDLRVSKMMSIAAGVRQKSTDLADSSRMWNANG